MEMTFNTINIQSHGFKWTTWANLTIPSNKLVAFPGLSSFPAYENLYVVGKSLFIKKVYRYTGVNPQTGLYRFATKNANGNHLLPRTR